MIEITMPRLSDTMEEGAIATWHKKPGDKVEVGDVLVEIETDKATMEYEAYEAGTLSKILVDEGELVSIGTPIAQIDDGKGSDTSEQAPDAAANATPSDASAPATEVSAGSQVSAEKSDGAAPAPDEGAETVDATEREAATSQESDETPAEPAAAPGGRVAEDGERMFASPLVRKLARENNLDLSSVKGTGPGGRIIRNDIEALLEGGAAAESAAPHAGAAPKGSGATGGANAKGGAAPASAAEPKNADAKPDEKRASEAVPMSSVRRVIARRLGESARSIPHFYVTATADAEELVKLRADLNTQLVAAGRPKVSINDLLIRANALALREHPLVNASYIDDQSTSMLVHHRVNVGVAVASENGLVVPVITDADTKTVTQLGAETKKLVGLANDKKLTTDQMSGGTFTISNLGMFGVEQFTAIINPPEGAILAVGGTKREPVVVGDEIVAHHVMRYTLSADHRIVDGALAAQYLQTLTRLIENPWTIIA
ncbi:dihydrolipoamide acetyltransferase family protein [Microbacterium sp. STN6]|uniref:dihydrolipoamide acetyltransferase family protein n=1 Tax=Microbacterium sp. STN6 TaxID=2995588 RepID=UPI002260F7E4|nr:dihydrolipoamide acetyltransferase family protein [Microbacterium sp. STN6]MCX7522954.1 dihydrolipoamide acetyltransferase family protein [Microbacterium sp. STN6]